MKKNTSEFLRLMNEANERIAAEEATKQAAPVVEGDPIRAERMQERRERWGQLRAQEHLSQLGKLNKRSQRTRFGDNNGDRI